MNPKLIFGMFLLSSAISSRAAVIVNTSLSLDQLQFTPSSGTFQAMNAWTATAFAEALDSLGGFDQHFDSQSGGNASASAATSLASAGSSSSAPSSTAAASSGVSIPTLDASASGTARGRLEGAFEVTGTAGPVTLHIAATLSGDQYLFTDPSGKFASSEMIFNFLMPGESSPTLSLDSLHTIGPDDTLHAPYSGTLSGDITIDPGTAYSFIAEVDAESHGIDSTPEPWTLSMILAGFAVIFARRRISSR
jgi:hypothetical protein